MSNKPLLSVIMPIHEGAKWIAATLDSLVSEPTENIEIIAIDSSPNDATSAIVRQYETRLPIRLSNRPDLVPWQTKTNLGVQLAKGDFCCILHQDDLWLPGRMDTVRRWLELAPNCVLHLAPTAIVDGRGRHVGKWRCPLPGGLILTENLLIERLLVQNFVSVPAPVFRRDAWLSCGGMDDGLWYTPDWDIWLKLTAAGPVIYSEEYTTGFRVHGSSLTVSGSRDEHEFRSQLEIVLARHLGRIQKSNRARVERAARASIDVNVSLAAASAGNLTMLLRAAGNVLSLGPGGIRRYLRDSRLWERLVPRLQSKISGDF